MKYFVSKTINKLTDGIYAISEYGQIVVQDGILYLPQGNINYSYTFSTGKWSKQENITLQRINKCICVEYNDLLILDNLIFNIFSKDEYIGFNKIEFDEFIKNHYQNRREQICFPIVNRGKLWYNHLSNEQLNELNEWYEQWLNVTETLQEPELPSWLNDKIVIEEDII